MIPPIVKFVLSPLLAELIGWVAEGHVTNDILLKIQIRSQIRITYTSSTDHRIATNFCKWHAS